MNKVMARRASGDQQQSSLQLLQSSSSSTSSSSQNTHLKCRLCGHVSRTQSGFYYHRTIHRPEKAHRCPHCPYRSHFSTSLRKHLVHVHSADGEDHHDDDNDGNDDEEDEMSMGNGNNSHYGPVPVLVHNPALIAKRKLKQQQVQEYDSTVPLHGCHISGCNFVTMYKGNLKPHVISHADRVGHDMTSCSICVSMGPRPRPRDRSLANKSRSDCNKNKNNNGMTLSLTTGMMTGSAATRRRQGLAGLRRRGRGRGTGIKGNSNNGGNSGGRWPRVTLTLPMKTLSRGTRGLMSKFKVPSAVSLAMGRKSMSVSTTLAQRTLAFGGREDAAGGGHASAAGEEAAEDTAVDRNDGLIDPSLENYKHNNNDNNRKYSIALSTQRGRVRYRAINRKSGSSSSGYRMPRRSATASASSSTTSSSSALRAKFMRMFDLNAYPVRESPFSQDSAVLTVGPLVPETTATPGLSNNSNSSSDNYNIINTGTTSSEVLDDYKPISAEGMLLSSEGRGSSRRKRKADTSSSFHTNNSSSSRRGDDDKSRNGDQDSHDGEKKFVVNVTDIIVSSDDDDNEKKSDLRILSPADDDSIVESGVSETGVHFVTIRF